MKVPAPRKAYNYLVPDEWYVVHDHPNLKKRTVELIVCGAACVGVAITRYPDNENVTFKQVDRVGA